MRTTTSVSELHARIDEALSRRLKEKDGVVRWYKPCHVWIGKRKNRIVKMMRNKIGYRFSDRLRSALGDEDWLKNEPLDVDA